MKIILFISSISKANPGLGGHYYSLIETAKRLAEGHEIIVLNIGTKKARALIDCDQKKHYVIEKGPKIWTIYKQVKTIISNEKPDIIHCFDDISLLWARLVGHKLKIPFSITKCGGPNAKYYPYAEHLVLFSEENRQYHLKSPKYKDSKIYLIPNRIQSFEDDNNRINLIENEISGDSHIFKFLRIARIGRRYLKSSLQLINLVNKLNNDGIKCCLIFIGIIDYENSYNQLKSQAMENCYFFTSKELTTNAKEIINVGDAVLGTGRSFMEASSKSKILLSPIKDGTIPLLINSKNFDKAFEYNFSERVNIKNYDENINYENIKKAILDNNEKLKYSSFAQNIFIEYFDTNKLNEKYEVVFNKMNSPNQKRYWDLMLHTLFVMRSYYQ